MSALLAVAAAAPQVYHGVRPAGYGYAAGQASKAFGAGHAAVHQVDNSKGLSEVAPAHGAVINNGAVPVGHHGVHHAAPYAAHPVAHHAVAHHAPLAHHGLVAHHAPAHAVVAHPVAHAVHHT